MYRRYLFPLLISALAASGARAQDARVVTRIVTDTVPAWKTWDTPTGTMNYPGAWVVDPSANGDTVVVFRKPVKNTTIPTPMVALLAHDLKGRSVAPKDPAMGGAGDVKVIARSEQDPDGGFSMEYTGTVNGGLMHSLEQVLVKDDHAYTLLYTAPEQAYEEHLFQAEAIMNSFVPR